MKNDPTFKFLALAVLAGVIVAFASPAHHDEPAPDAAPAAATLAE